MKDFLNERMSPPSCSPAFLHVGRTAIKNYRIDNLHKQMRSSMRTKPSKLMSQPISSTLSSLFSSYQLSDASNILQSSNSIIVAMESDVELIQTFEPVVNGPALSAFLLVVVVFGLLQLRINAISLAANRRTEALKNLREVKAKQLSSENFSDAEKISYLVDEAKDEYSMALQQEANLRTIIPGVRIVAPNRPDFSDENVAAAKLFLDMDLVADYNPDTSNTSPNKTLNNEPKKGKDISTSWLLNKDSKMGDKSDPNKGFSNGAIAIMTLIAISQIALLYMLSFDPMKANDVFTSVSGPPPSDLPFSSW